MQAWVADAEAETERIEKFELYEYGDGTPRPLSRLCDRTVERRLIRRPIQESQPRLHHGQAMRLQLTLHAIRVGEVDGDEPMQVVSGGVGGEHVHFIAPPRDGLDSHLQDFFDGNVRRFGHR